MAEVYFCTDCAAVMTWDSDGTLSKLDEPCWYCSECGNIIPPNNEYPVPKE